jgi:D-3-phosphoglycerate dehydrogenase / 2-oxoglutarate reductase
MKILIADKAEAARDGLVERGFDVVFEPALSDETLTGALAEHAPRVLVVRSTKVQRPQFQAARGLGLVVRAGAGVNTIDLDAAAEHGVYVSNCPGMNAVAVAELAFGHILNADRRIADNVADLRAGRWRKKHFGGGRGLKGRTLGVVGTGAIGQAVIRRALAFEMSVVAFDPVLDEAGAEALGIARADSVVEVAGRADILTVHVALNPATRGLVNAQVLGALPEGAIFVNTSRGEVVDEAALADAVRDRGLLAGLDVFHDEPTSDGPWEAPLAALDGVYGTHHIAASTAQAQQAVADETVRVAVEFDRTGVPPNAVNAPVLKP